MFGINFYHESSRDVVVAFGSLFNNIMLVRKNNAGAITQRMKVPLAYGPKQKWLSRISEDPKISKSVAITLPRMGFEIVGVEYDSTRKLNRAIKVKKKAGDTAGVAASSYMPVPYNLNFELYVMSKNSDDALQIVEQILPFFQPEYAVTLKERPELDIIRDVPIVLNSVSYQDEYEGEFVARKAIIYTLTFTAKYFLYGPITSQKVIKQVQVDQYTNTPDVAVAREQRYTATPDPVTASFDDDFGFNETTSYFEDAKQYNPTTGQDEQID
jgi:hypothetical protein